MEPNPNPDPAAPESGPDPESPAEPDKADQTGHAVYDLTVRRFVGAVHPTAKEARDAVVKVKGHKYETRRV